MSYTFGAATGDLITRGLLSSSNALSAFLFAGWVYPTTLTTGRGLFGCDTAGLTGIKVGATTSELSVTMDQATTDAVFDTSGLGLVVNVVQYVAVLFTATTGGAACRVWIGTIDTPPVEVTVTTTTGAVGAPVQVSTYTLGNLGSSGTVAWQGQIDQCIFYIQSSPNQVSGIPLAAAGTVTQAEADYILETLVVPFWCGRPGVHTGQIGGASSEMVLWDLACNPALQHVKTLGSTIQVGPLNPTIVGATWSEFRLGGRPVNPWPVSPQLVRR